MNRVELIGRVTRDPEGRHTGENDSLALARFSIAINRRTKEKEVTADFISCVAFGPNADFAVKYLRKGMRVGVCGRLQTGSYTNRDGQKVYTTDVVVDGLDFADGPKTVTDENGFMAMPDAEEPFGAQ